MIQTPGVKESIVRFRLVLLPFFPLCKPKSDRGLKFPRLSNLVSRWIMPVSLQDLDAAGRYESATVLWPFCLCWMCRLTRAMDGAWLSLLVPAWLSRESMGSRGSQTGGCGLAAPFSLWVNELTSPRDSISSVSASLMKYGSWGDINKQIYCKDGMGSKEEHSSVRG